MSWYNIFFDNKLVVVKTQNIMTRGFLKQDQNIIGTLCNLREYQATRTT